MSSVERSFVEGSLAAWERTPGDYNAALQYMIAINDDNANIAIWEKTYEYNQSTEVVLMHANVYNRVGRKDDALNVLKNSAGGDRMAADDRILSAIAVEYQNDQNWVEAIQYWKAIKSLSPRDAILYAQARIENKEIDAGIEALLSLYAQRPHREHVTATLLEALKKYSDIEKGRYIWKRLASMGGPLAHSPELEKKFGVSKVFWPDGNSFKDALFAALSDPDVARHWAHVFGSEIHIYPRPQLQMSDDEYAIWVREQVVRREAAAERERLQQAVHREKWEERQWNKERLEQTRRLLREAAAERERLQAMFRRKWEERQRNKQEKLEQTRRFLREAAAEREAMRRQQQWRNYRAAFQPPPQDANLELLLLWQRRGVLWPTPSGLESDISIENIKKFIDIYAREMTGGDRKRAVKNNQFYWHPDKFEQNQRRRLEKLTEERKNEIMTRVNEVSQILNKLANE
jgi:hypothetical protein